MASLTETYFLILITFYIFS